MKCTTCTNPAAVEITDTVFLCDRCEGILRREFPSFRRAPSAETPAELNPRTPVQERSAGAQFQSPAAATPGEALAGGDPATTPAASATFPELPAFLNCMEVA